MGLFTSLQVGSEKKEYVKLFLHLSMTDFCEILHRHQTPPPSSPNAYISNARITSKVYLSSKLGVTGLLSLTKKEMFSRSATYSLSAYPNNP